MSDQADTIRAKYASRFDVPDAGRYANDWTSRIDAVLAHCDALKNALLEIERKADNVIPDTGPIPSTLTEIRAIARDALAATDTTREGKP